MDPIYIDDASQLEAIMRRLPVLPEKENLVDDLAWDVLSASREAHAVSRGDNAAMNALDLLRK